MSKMRIRTASRKSEIDYDEDMKRLTPLVRGYVATEEASLRSKYGDDYIAFLIKENDVTVLRSSPNALPLSFSLMAEFGRADFFVTKIDDILKDEDEQQRR